MKLRGPHIREGLHFLRRRLSHRRHQRYIGSPGEIIRSVVRDNFDGSLFSAGQGNHRMFYIRDTGLAAQGILYMGMREELRTCMRTALEVWQNAGRITTSINHRLEAVDVFAYGADSLSLLLRTLRMVGDHQLIDQYRHVLNRESERYTRDIFDRNTSLVRRDLDLSTTKDNTHRPSPLYANIHLLVLQKEFTLLREAGHQLLDPLAEHDIAAAVLREFWMEERQSFRDALGHEYIAADQIFIPYFAVLEDARRTAAILDTIIDAGLADPLPLQYTARAKRHTEHKLLSLVARNYQGDTVWTMLGVPFISVLHERKDPRTGPYLQAYSDMILRDGNCLEIYNRDLTMYRALGYVYDEGMTWFAPLVRVFEEHRAADDTASDTTTTDRA